MFTDTNTKMRIKVARTYYMFPTWTHAGISCDVYCGSCPTWVHPCIRRYEDAVKAAWSHIDLHRRGEA